MLRPALLLLLALSQTSCILERKDKGPSKEERVSLHYENALRFQEMGDFDRAFDQAQRGLEADPNDRKLRLLTGWILVRRRTRISIATAETIFRSLLDKEDYRIQLGLATCLERKGIFFDEAARAESADKGYAKKAHDAWTESIEYYDKVLAKQAGDRDALNGLMRTYGLLGLDEESIAASTQLIASVDQHSAFWKGQLIEDISASREAQIRGWLEGNSQLMTKTHLHRASILRRLDRPDEAVAELRAVVELDPDIAEVHSRLAQQLFELGRFREARTAIDRYLALSDDAFDDPNYQRAWELRNEADAALRDQGIIPPR